MTNQGILPDVVTYTLLLRAVLTPPAPGQSPALGLDPNCEVISDECSVVDEEINLEPSSAPVASQPKFSGALAARYGLDILRRMREDGGRNVPNAVTYTAYLNGCAIVDAHELALSALSDMLDEAVTPKLKTFEAIVHLADRFDDRPPPEVVDVKEEEEEEEDEGMEEEEGEEPVAVKQRPKPPPPPPLSAASGALQLTFYQRVVDIFEGRRLPLHAVVYMPMLQAALAAGDAKAVSELLGARREGQSFPLRRTLRNAVLGLEEEAEAWLTGEMKLVR